jgi:hypothetical protein
MKQFGQYVWKQHKDSPCIAIFISNYQNFYVFLFILYGFSSTKLENKRVKQVLSGGEEVEEEGPK